MDQHLTGCCCAGCLARVNDPASAISANLPSSSLGSYVLFDEKWGADDLGTGAVVEWAFTVGLFPGGDVQNVSTGSTLYRAVRDAFDRWEELIEKILSRTPPSRAARLRWPILQVTKSLSMRA